MNEPKREETDAEREIREWLTGLVRDEQAENGGSIAEAFGRISQMPEE